MIVRSVLISVLLFLPLFFSSCAKDDSCLRCAENIDSTFEGLYFKIILNDKLEPALVHYDSVIKISRSYDLCSFEKIKNTELTKIIRADGNLRAACEDNSIRLVEITKFDVVETCLPKVQKLIGDYVLYNEWLIYYIQTQDTIVFPPCEGYSNINFVDNSENLIAGNISENWFEGNYSVINDSTFQMPEILSQGLSIGTASQVYFENIFRQVFEPNATITFSLDGNFLSVSNKSGKSLIKLYLKP